jgi:hypothetical protein
MLWMKIALCTHYNCSFIFPTCLYRKNNFNSPLVTLMFMWVDTFGVLWAYRLSWMLGGQPQDRQMWKSHITFLIMSGIKQTRLHKFLFCQLSILHKNLTQNILIAQKKCKHMSSNKKIYMWEIHDIFWFYIFSWRHDSLFFVYYVSSNMHWYVS